MSPAAPMAVPVAAPTGAARGDCPASSTGGHYYEKQGGQWVCSLCGSPR